MKGRSLGASNPKTYRLGESLEKLERAVEEVEKKGGRGRSEEKRRKGVKSVEMGPYL